MDSTRGHTEWLSKDSGELNSELRNKVANLVDRILPREVLNVEEANKKYLRTEVVQYFAFKFTQAQLDGSSYRDESQPNVIMDNDGKILAIGPRWDKMNHQQGQVIEVTEYSLGSIGVLARRFEGYVNN